jgi:SSS family solute:Na+ symporter
MATQCSVISFISIPAFVAVKEGGGLTWLQYELAVPLAMIFVMVLLIPFFRKLELISVYEYLEMRFSPGVRLFISAVFLVSRSLATGLGVYTSALVIQVCTDLPLWSVILFVGVVTLIYDTIGGMKAVVWSDVVQMFVLVAGLFLCIGYAVSIAGGVEAVTASVEPERWRAIDLDLGLSGGETPFWAFLVGGFFLYASYYGTDQSQTQRELSAPTTDDTKRSLVLNGFARFPITALYLVLGLAVGAAYLESPELQAAIAGSKPDYLVPQFVVTVLPTGVRAVLVAAMLAAGMSSLDSALNSLSASTMRDFIQRGRNLPSSRVLLWSKLTTVAWGVAITGFAFFVGNIADTVIEGINKIGSAFYGPILASFVVGVVSRRHNAPGIVAGVVAGVAFNISLWLFVPRIHWMWWNLFGFVATVAVSAVVSSLTAPPDLDKIEHYTLADGFLKAERPWMRTYGLLVGFFVFMLALGIWLTSVAA